MVFNNRKFGRILSIVVVFNYDLPVIRMTLKNDSLLDSTREDLGLNAFYALVATDTTPSEF